MALVQYTFQRGEPIQFGDRVESGDILGGHTMRARMKPAEPQLRDRMPGDAVPVVSPAFTTTFVAAAGDEPAHWLHSLSAAQSLAVAAGEYLADSALLLDGAVVWISDPVRIVLREAASGG